MKNFYTSMLNIEGTKDNFTFYDINQIQKDEQELANFLKEVQEIELLSPRQEIVEKILQYAASNNHTNPI